MKTLYHMGSAEYQYQISETEPNGTEWNHEEVLKKALEERETLLKNNPKLKHLQKEIDHNLSGAENLEDKMTILGNMIGNRLNSLRDESKKLEALCKKAGIKIDLPLIQQPCLRKAAPLFDINKNK